MTVPDSMLSWQQSPLGTQALLLETRVLQDALSEVVGFEFLQVGRWGNAAQLSSAARTQHRHWVAPDASGTGAIRSEYDALPVATGSIEAVLLPHTLEHAARPHEVLREVERVLVGEGILLACGFNPLSPWGLRHYAGSRRFPPGCRRLLSERRLRDWVGLLGLEVESVRRYLFIPPWSWGLPGGGRDWLEERGPRLLPPLAGAYLLRARKRVHAVTPIRPRWQGRPAVVGGIVEPTSRNAA
jgi:SAM-dependent methyltransferase